MKKLPKYALFISFIFSPWFILAQSLEDGFYATIYTKDYQILVELYPDKAPMTVANFVGLAEGSVKNAAFEPGIPFFDGSRFDRVVPGHVIQGGVPESALASDAGYTIPNEINSSLSHNIPGVLGMANEGPDTGNNVFYITLGNRAYLDGDYAIFGRAIDSCPQFIEQNTIIDSIRIIRIGEWAERYKVNDKILNRLKRKVQQYNDSLRAEQYAFEEKFIAENYPHTEISEFGWQYLVLTKGKGRKVKKQKQVMIRFTGKTPQGTVFGSTNTCSAYWLPENGDPGYCEYYPNKTIIVNGLDDAILEMKPGAKWIVILKPEYAYGIRGFYPPLDWGDKRFHISPNTTIIYEVEILRQEK